ncbi:MAG: HAD family phosphatase, partial [Candidatus Cloacimonetes bacterium]|nr:HAD family phosphatase [Candidatus Cloacimonadota bacterium]
EMLSHHYEFTISLKDGVLELLELLTKNNIRLGVGTSNSQHLAETVLKANGVFDKFQSVISGRDRLKGKPFPDIFLKVAEELKAKPENCLVIEDVLAGVEAAKNAGMTVFAVYDKYNTAETNLIRKTADFYAESFNKMIENIEKLIT